MMKIDPNAVYVCIESFAGSDIVGRVGMRLRGDHAAVQRATWAFLPDGATEEDAIRQRIKNAAAPESSQPVHAIPVPPIIRPQDQMICIQSCWTTVRTKGEGLTAGPGDQLPKTARLVREFPERFIPVVAPGLTHSNSLVATSDMQFNGDDGVRLIRRGQWVRRGDPLVAVNWQHFEQPPLPVAADHVATIKRSGSAIAQHLREGMDALKSNRRARKQTPEPLVAVVDGVREEAD